MADRPDFAGLLAGPCPAVLTTYRPDGSALTSPVWVGLGEEAFEIVMVAHYGKVRNLQRDPRCLLVMFEVSSPFRGVEARGDAVIETGQRASDARRGIASRYLGDEAGQRFANARPHMPSVIVRVASGNARK